jgi:3-methyladenine DNA glycosylase AlkD
VIEAIQNELEARADAEKKAWWERYVKGAAFRGTPMADVRDVVNAHVAAHGAGRPLAYALIAEPRTEDKLAGVLMLAEHLIDELTAGDLPALRGLLAADHLADWNSCDWFCVKVLGRMLERGADREQRADTVAGWTADRHLWVRRAGLVAFVNLAPKADDATARRILDGAVRNVADDRRFAQTSVGWVLRELSKARPDDVREFLAEHGSTMSAEARRAAGARL